MGQRTDRPLCSAGSGPSESFNGLLAGAMQGIVVGQHRNVETPPLRRLTHEAAGPSCVTPSHIRIPVDITCG